MEVYNDTATPASFLLVLMSMDSPTTGLPQGILCTSLQKFIVNLGITSETGGKE
jgi:hypothetical protein